MNTTRRELLGSAVVAGAAMATLPASAQTPSAASAPAKQAPGFYRFKVGDAEVTVLHDGYVARKSEGMAKNVPQADIDAALRSAFIDPNNIENVYNVTHVKIGSRSILIDGGFADNGAPTTGQIAANMAAAGIDAASIDTILVTHFHPDHINGIRKKAGTVTYPKAQILVPAAEWNHWMDDGRMTQTPEAQRGIFNLSRRVFGPNAGDVKRFEANTEVAPGITAIATPGHTPGHTSFVVASGNAKVIVQGDVSGIASVFVRNPGWHSSFDMDAAMAEATRRKLYDMAAAERMPIIGYHFPFPAMGYIAKDGNGYRLELAQWRSAI